MILLYKHIMDTRIERVLITNEQILNGVEKAATWINSTYHGKDLVLITILKGSIPFFGAIIPKIKVDCTIDYMHLSSFKGSHEAVTPPELLRNVSSELKNKDVLLVEDIIDSGRTIKMIIDILQSVGCRSIKILTMLDKPAGRTVELIPDFVCFTIPKEFIVGFGLDYQEQLRNLPYIGILKKEIYQK